jgi:hypothetical protein
LYSDNILERTFNTLVGKAVSAAKSVLLLGGNGWSQDDVSQLKKHAKAVHHILDSGSLVRCVVAARDTVVSR